MLCVCVSKAYLFLAVDSKLDISEHSQKFERISCGTPVTGEVKHSKLTYGTALKGCCLPCVATVTKGMWGLPKGQL